MHDLENSLRDKFHHIPFVHSAKDPLWDIEYADDIVLISRSREVTQHMILQIQEIATIINQRKGMR